MRQKILAQSQKLLRRVLKVFSLGAVLFIMEACYGVPYGPPTYSEIQIMVVDTEGNPIPNIAVSVNTNDGERVLAHSDNKGVAKIEIDYPTFPLKVTLVDVDKETNGYFQSKSLELDMHDNDITVALQPVE